MRVQRKQLQRAFFYLHRLGYTAVKGNFLHMAFAFDSLHSVTTTSPPPNRGPVAKLTVDEFQALAGFGVSRAITAGDELFRRGEGGRCMYLIDSGNVRLSFDESLADKVLGPGQFFGELSVFIGEHLRFARAVAETSGVLYEIQQSAFEEFLHAKPVIAAGFMRRSFAYLVAGEHRLVDTLRRRNEDLMQALDSLRQTRSELSFAQQLIRTDEMTGLANRRGLYRFLDELGRVPVPGMRLAVLLLDIDRFKQLNDRSGHLAGDGVLRAVAEELQVHAGPLEIACRLGGDEFALVVRVPDANVLGQRANSLCEAVSCLRLSNLKDQHISISVGASFCDDPGGWSAWYSEADYALYEAKNAGGGQARVRSQ